MRKQNVSKNRFWGSSVTASMIVLAVVLLGSWLTETKANDSPTPKVIDRDSVGLGKTYGELSAAWFQWAFSIPVSEHPLFDNGPCDVGQSGNVWFLGGKFCSTTVPSCRPSSATRQCTVPVGKALYFPIINIEDSTLENPGKTLADLRAGIESVINQAQDLSVEFDGKPIRDVEERFRVQGDAWGFTLPTDNLLNAIGEGPFAAGTYFPAVDDGFYVLLAPPKPGPHVLHFHGAVPAFNFSLDITYQLLVKER